MKITKERLIENMKEIAGAKIIDKIDKEIGAALVYYDKHSDESNTECEKTQELIAFLNDLGETRGAMKKTVAGNILSFVEGCYSTTV